MLEFPRRKPCSQGCQMELCCLMHAVLSGEYTVHIWQLVLLFQMDMWDVSPEILKRFQYMKAEGRDSDGVMGGGDVSAAKWRKGRGVKVKSLSVVSCETRCLGAFWRGSILTDSLMYKSEGWRLQMNSTCRAVLSPSLCTLQWNSSWVSPFCCAASSLYNCYSLLPPQPHLTLPLLLPLILNPLPAYIPHLLMVPLLIAIT